MTKERRICRDMWRDIAERIRSGVICNIDDVEAEKDFILRKHRLTYENDCWLCEYIGNDCYVCPLNKKYRADCQQTGNPFRELVNHFDDYPDNERESFADMAECIANVLEKGYKA